MKYLLLALLTVLACHPNGDDLRPAPDEAIVPIDPVDAIVPYSDSGTLDALLGPDSGAMVDSGFASNCEDEEVQPCYTGDPQTIGIGRCAPGLSSCYQGIWGSCLGQILPADGGSLYDTCGPDAGPGGPMDAGGCKFIYLHTERSDAGPVAEACPNVNGGWTIIVLADAG